MSQKDHPNCWVLNDIKDVSKNQFVVVFSQDETKRHTENLMGGISCPSSVSHTSDRDQTT